MWRFWVWIEYYLWECSRVEVGVFGTSYVARWLRAPYVRWTDEHTDCWER